MRIKPDDLGLCHRDGCGNDAKFECEWVLVGTPIKALTTIKVCDDHKNDAADYILNTPNRNNFVDLLVNENWCPDYKIAYMTVKLNSFIEFLPIETPDER